MFRRLRNISGAILTFIGIFGCGNNPKIAILLIIGLLLLISTGDCFEDPYDEDYRRTRTKRKGHRAETQ